MTPNKINKTSFIPCGIVKFPLIDLEIIFWQWLAWIWIQPRDGLGLVWYSCKSENSFSLWKWKPHQLVISWTRGGREVMHGGRAGDWVNEKVQQNFFKWGLFWIVTWSLQIIKIKLDESPVFSWPQWPVKTMNPVSQISHFLSEPTVDKTYVDYWPFTFDFSLFLFLE